MALTENHFQALAGSQEAFEKLLQERMREAVRIALSSVLEEEVAAFIGALPYERTEQRRDQQNGHYTRDLETTMGQSADLPVPRTRRGYHTLESEYAQWKTRKLCERYVYAEASGTYFTVIYNGEGCKMPMSARQRCVLRKMDHVREPHLQQTTRPDQTGVARLVLSYATAKFIRTINACVVVLVMHSACFSTKFVATHVYEWSGRADWGPIYRKQSNVYMSEDGYGRSALMQKSVAPPLSFLVYCCLLALLSSLLVWFPLGLLLNFILIGGLSRYIGTALYLLRPPHTVYMAFLYAPGFVLRKMWVLFVLRRSKKHSNEWARTSSVIPKR